MNIHKLAGTKIEDKWTIDSYIAKGGQGVVYKAREIATGDLYAVKVFDSFERVTLEKRKRIVNEINVLSKLQESKYIVKTFGNNISADTESKIGFTYYVMDFAKYGSLKDNNYYLGDVEVCLRLFKQILLGVKEAHSKSIIHRDLKPENILFFPTQKDIVISDFGLGLLKDISTDERVTQEDEFLGPMFFISPEQYKSPSDVDERSDIYSLGKILYFMLTGQGKTFREQVESLASVFVGKSIFIPLVQQNLIEKMIVEDKNKRFSNVGEAIDAVEAILQSMDSTNVNRFLVQKNDQPKFDIYKFLLTGDERNKFINDFPKNIDRSLVELEYIAKDLLKKGKVQTLDELYKDLFEKHKRGIGKIAIHCVKSFVANPKELLELCKTYKNQALPKYYLSRYYNKLRTYSNAHKLMLDAIESESTKDLKLTYVLELIDICKNCKCSLDHSPSNQLQKLIEESSNKREKIELYKILGNHLLEKGKDNLLGLKFLEAYLDEHPDDSDIRFKCAYEYSKIKEYGLALFHYNSYLDLNEYDSYALNNIGHIYDTKAMPIKAMKTYRQAYDLGNTLSGSNIALKYLEIGLIKEADKLLKDIIKNNDEYEKNVDIVFGQMANSDSNENTTEDEIKKYVPTKNYHNIEYIRNHTSNSVYEWTGHWLLDTSTAMIITKNESGVYQIGSFGIKTVTGVARFERNGMLITKVDIAFWQTYTKGCLYLISNDEARGYMEKDDGTVKEINMKRIINPTTYLLEENRDPLLRSMQ